MPAGRHLQDVRGHERLHQRGDRVQRTRRLGQQGHSPVAEDRARPAGRALPAQPQPAGVERNRRRPIAGSRFARRSGNGSVPPGGETRGNPSPPSQRAIDRAGPRPSIVASPLFEAAVAESGRLDRRLADAAQAMRKMVADEAAEVQFDELPGQFAFPAVGRFVGPKVAAEAAARAQRAEARRGRRPAAGRAVRRRRCKARIRWPAARPAGCGRSAPEPARACRRRPVGTAELFVRPAVVAVSNDPSTPVSVCEPSAEWRVNSAAEIRTSASSRPKLLPQALFEPPPRFAIAAASSSGCEAVTTITGRRPAAGVGLRLPGQLPAAGSGEWFGPFPDRPARRAS